MSIQPAALLAAIVQSSDDAIVTKGLDGIITTWNAAAERLFGYSAPEAIGRHITLIIPQDHLAEETFVMASVIAGTGVSHFETVRRRKDGTLVNVSLAVSPVRDSHGRVVGASKIARDISSQKVIAGHLREEMRVVETLNRIGAEMIATLDVNRVMRVVVEASADVTAATFALFVDPGGPSGEEAHVRHVRPGTDAKAFAHLPPDVDTLYRVDDAGPALAQVGDVDDGRADGGVTRRIRSYLSVPLTARSGRPLGRVCLGHVDPGAFTERHQRIVKGIAGWGALALENAQLFDDAQQANRLKDDFLATLSHELRTPLNAIMGWAQILGSTVVDERARERAVETIQRNARVQARLVDDLLDVSRIVSGKLVLRREDVDLTQVVAAAIDDVRPSAAERGIELRSAIHEGGIATGDAARLQQIVWNLLSNAVKFTPRGGVVTVALARDGQTAELTVSDTGQGIEPEFLPHVFDRFRQADPSSTRRHGGLGLGLGIVQHLAQAHGGSVRAESRGIGQGATFTIRLPARDVGHLVADRIESWGPRSIDLSRRLVGLRVLAVDDEPDATEMLAIAFEGAGAVVVTANTAREALAEAVGDRFDVVLADIGMPGMDGYSLIRAMRADPALKPFLGVALTAYVGPHDRTHALDAGFDIHLAKPLPPEDVVSAITRALGR